MSDDLTGTRAALIREAAPEPQFTEEGLRNADRWADLQLLRENVKVALEQNLLDTTGGCVCLEDYVSRALRDPQCNYHNADGTTDDESVERIIALVEPLLAQRDAAMTQMETRP